MNIKWNKKWNNQQKAANDCDDEVKVVTSPMAAESQSQNCAVELDPHQPADEVQEGLNLTAIGFLFLIALSMGIAPGLVQLGFVIV